MTKQELLDAIEPILHSDLPQGAKRGFEASLWEALGFLEGVELFRQGAPQPSEVLPALRAGWLAAAGGDA